MIYYIYDGSFDGLLTCIYEAYYRREKPEKILFREDDQENLLVQKVYIEQDKEKAEKVYTAIRTKISLNALQNVFYTFLSEDEDAGSLIYRYIQLGFKVGKDIDGHLSDERVLDLHKVVQRVTKEKHLMLGLVRFRKVGDNLYYAPITPDNQILGLLAPHFSKRMADQNWIIYDTRRNMAAIYDQKEWILMEMVLERSLEVGEEELFYQQLWQQYFKSIAIKNRMNPKLQKQHMPKRYWKNLVEKI
ncbi:putative DNA metabolism protein [Anaerosolibacter carboniphilus]|uniref:Putative DNA metabolism protein n=1 Tax=Anaerosolibacter carboniphilus TaxID=1417629 RepID=A0A841KV44_9FIRM|nr:TIGR03915 family putative DNA repair protein [Anaerosolibacter carboniphilus]MBB6217526.1 putative DNA metabolism protein [Anaerosolibacter carboniphilus]